MSFPGAQARPAPQESGLPYKWKVLISVIFGIFMVILDTTVVNVALPTLRQEYQVGLQDAQWIISVYVLALGISTPLSGYLADRFGIKRMYVLGLALFVLGSFLCGVAPSLPFLIVARALQATGGGIALPLGTAQLFSAFPPQEQGLALGIFGIALLVAPALGPILGGLLVDGGLWRAIFFINLPIGIVGVTLASLFLRERRPDQKPRPDPLGFVFSVIGFGAFLYAASQAANDGWTAPNVVIGFAAGISGLIVFELIELFVAKQPLLDLRLFRKPVFLVASLIGYVTVIALFGAEFLMPVYLQALRGRTALETGLLLLPLALTAGVFTPLAGRLYDKIGPRVLVVAGFSILLINTWQFAQLQGDTPIGWIMVLLALRGAALGLTVQTTFTTALSAVPLPQLARGSSLVNASRYLVQSIGVAVLATVLASTLSPAIKAQSQQFQERPPPPGVTRFGICEVPETLVLSPGAPPQPLPPPARAQLDEACKENLQGFDHAYTLTFYLALAAIVIGLFLPGWPLKWAGRQRAAPSGAGAARGRTEGRGPGGVRSAPAPPASRRGWPVRRGRSAGSVPRPGQGRRGPGPACGSRSRRPWRCPRAGTTRSRPPVPCSGGRRAGPGPESRRSAAGGCAGRRRSGCAGSRPACGRGPRWSRPGRAGR